MNVCIIHDSEHNNGRMLADRMGEVFTSLGAETYVGHRAETTPESVASRSPDLLVLGAAIRKFMTGPASQSWMRRLSKTLGTAGGSVACGAIFITHMMPRSMAEGRAERFTKKVAGYGVVGSLYPEWFSGQVRKMMGPFEDGVMEDGERFARELFTWVESTIGSLA